MYQVFEKTKDGTKIHNFKNKRAAQKKQKELVKAGKNDGEIWDTQNNSLSNLLRF